MGATKSPLDRQHIATRDQGQVATGHGQKDCPGLPRSEEACRGRKRDRKQPCTAPLARRWLRHPGQRPPSPRTRGWKPPARDELVTSYFLIPDRYRSNNKSTGCGQEMSHLLKRLQLRDSGGRSVDVTALRGTWGRFSCRRVILFCILPCLLFLSFQDRKRASDWAMLTGQLDRWSCGEACEDGRRTHTHLTSRDRMQ